MNAQERLAPVLTRLEKQFTTTFENPRPKKIQGWVEYLFENGEQAKTIHNHAIKLLRKYQSKKNTISAEERFTDAVQIANFKHSSDKTFPPFNSNIFGATTGIDITGISRATTEKMVKEYAQEVLIASLFALNREQLGDRLSKDMERQQIEAVSRSVINGDHVQLSTGQGKSSTVIPIASIVESLTSEDHKSVVVSINKNLVSELENETKSLIGRAGKKGMAIPLFTENKSREDKSVGEEVKKKMMKEALLGNQEYSQPVEKEVFTTYWGEDLSQQQDELMDVITGAIGGTKITFMSKDDFVFAASRGGEAFRKMCPKVFFDEIDAPYVIGETYQSTHEDMYISPDHFIDMATRYVLDRVVLSQLDPEADFEVYKGKGVITDGAEARLAATDWAGILKGRVWNREVSRSFEEATALIGTQLGIESGSLNVMRKLLWDNMKDHLTHKRTKNPAKRYEMNEAVIGAADNLANGYYSLNKIFISEGEGITVRSGYFDQLMENHKFDPDTHISMLALTGKFAMVNLMPKASDSIKFPSVLTMMGDKIVGFSGTLIQRDLITGRPVTSPLASFLRQVTGKDIFESPPPETKKPPNPVVKNTIAEVKNTVIATIKSFKEKKDTKPILLISHYDTKTTRELFAGLSETYGDELEIEMLPSIPSKPERLAAYYQELKAKSRGLADGKTRILVSSGSLGIGANIVKTDGTFPDLRVGIIGLPENESQVRQNLGRRRMKGNDFFWIVDKQSLRERATTLNDQQFVLFKAFLTQEKSEELIDGLPVSGPDNLNFVLRLIHDAHVSQGTNEEFTVTYDNFFRQDILPLAKKYLQSRLKEEFFDKDTDWTKDEDALSRLDRLTRIYGLPDTLYDRLLDADITLGIQSSDTRDYLVKLKNRISESDIVGQMINTWVDLMQKEADYVDGKIYGRGKQRIHQFVFLDTPKDFTYEEKSNASLLMSGDKTNTVSVGTVKVKDTEVPGIRFADGKVYIIGNMRTDQIAQVNNMYLYSTGGKSLMFTPLVI